MISFSFSCHLENWFVIPLYQQLAHIFTRRKWNLFTPKRSIVWENQIFTTRKQSIINWWHDYIQKRNDFFTLYIILMTNIELIILVCGKKLALRHKFTYQVIQSLVSIHHFIFKKTRWDGDVNYCRCGNDCIGLIIITVVIFYR